MSSTDKVLAVFLVMIAGALIAISSPAVAAGMMAVTITAIVFSPGEKK